MLLTACVALQLIAPDGARRCWSAALIVVLVSYVLIGVGPRTLGPPAPLPASALAVAGAGAAARARCSGPLTKLLILIGNAITPGQGFRQGPFSSEVELRELVDMAEHRRRRRRGRARR